MVVILKLCICKLIWRRHKVRHSLKTELGNYVYFPCRESPQNVLVDFRGFFVLTPSPMEEVAVMLQLWFKPINRINIVSISCEICLKWMPQNFIDDWSILLQMMVWCCQATGHHAVNGFLTRLGVARWKLGLMTQHALRHVRDRYLQKLHGCEMDMIQHTIRWGKRHFRISPHI